MSVTIGRKPAPVLFSGLVAPGLYQVNVQVPLGVNPGAGGLQLVYAVDQFIDDASNDLRISLRGSQHVSPNFESRTFRISDGGSFSG